MSREKFEAWMTDEQWFHGSDFEWDEGRNCYAQFGIHLAYKAWQAASKASEQQLSESRREFTAANATIHNLELQLADAEARGVDKFATEIGSVYKQLRPGSNHAHALKSVVFRAVEFAAKLRQGAKS